MFLLNGGFATWKSSKQKMMANSTCKYEYMAASKDAKEATCLKNIIGDVGVVSRIKEPLQIFCDNEGVVTLTKEPKD